MKLGRHAGRGAVRGAVLSGTAVVLLALAGCGDLPAGAAASVNGDTISFNRVNDLASAQCVAAAAAAKQGAQTTTQSISRIKQQSLGLLMDSELTHQWGKREDIKADPKIAQGFYGQLEPGIDPLPGKSRRVLTDVFTDWADARAILVQAGAQQTGKTPDLGNVQDLLNAGVQQRSSWLKKATIHTDPRYSPSKQGFPGGGDGSVSKPVSAFGKDTAKSQPNPAWVSGLPADQKCG